MYMYIYIYIFIYLFIINIFILFLLWRGGGRSRERETSEKQRRMNDSDLSTPHSCRIQLFSLPPCQAELQHITQQHVPRHPIGMTLQRQILGASDKVFSQKI